MKHYSIELQRLLEPVVSDLGYELFGVQRIPQHRQQLIRVYIDQSGGVNISDCERVSEQVSGILDVEDAVFGKYVLEVSSPGWDRPLFTPEHFTRFAGEKVKMVLARMVEGRRRISGTLLCLDNHIVLVQAQDKVFQIPYDAIDSCHLDPA